MAGGRLLTWVLLTVVGVVLAVLVAQVVGAALTDLFGRVTDGLQGV